MICVIDNYDSFVHNLARYFRRLGCPTQVVRNDEVDVNAIRAMDPAAIVISPGPCTPVEAGCSLDVARQFTGVKPILGICLGHQAIVQALGGKVIRAFQPMHGRSSQVVHTRSPVFEKVRSPFQAGRYHSLVTEVTAMPGELEVTARTSDGIVMAVEHQKFPVVGLQFHPESVLTEDGIQILANFLNVAGIAFSNVGAVESTGVVFERENGIHRSKRLTTRAAE